MDYRRHFSYVKDIYIELKDYTFFHSPSQGETAGGRFVGRRKLKERLSEILSKTETRSGAYLVTGYRGVGKSSLVNQVLDELSLKSLGEIWRKVSRPVLYTLLICVFLKTEATRCLFAPYPEMLTVKSVSFPVAHFILISFFFVIGKGLARTIHGRRGHSRVTTYFILLVLAVIFEILWKGIIHVRFYYSGIMLYAFCWNWLAETSPNKNDLRIQYTTNFARFLINSMNVFRMGVHRFPKETHYHLIQALFFVISPLVFIGPFFLEEGEMVKYTNAEAVVLLLTALVWFWCLINLVRFLVWAIFLRHKRRILFDIDLQAWFRNLMNYSRRINIRINLGHEELKEGEVLRVIAKKIYNEYRVVKNLFWGVPFNFLNTALKFAVIVCILSVIFKLPEVKKLNAEFKREVGFTYLFPSQDFDNKLPPEPVPEYSRWYYVVTATRFMDDMIGSVANAVVVSTSITQAHFELASGNYLTQLFGQLMEHVLPDVISLPKPKMDYVFILSFVILWLIANGIMARRPFNIVTHASILKRFKDLNDRLDAMVEMEGTQTVGSSRKWFSLSARRKQSFPIAGAREIEAELISILDDIDKVPRILNRPEFVIVLDELDKIRRHENNTIQDKESENPSEGSDPADEGSRTHRESVIRLLANLKHFFTTAKAKFIFIAGREMYDASMADISDRNYFMGSIFHDVIYVNSLLTDIPEPTSKQAHSTNHRSYYTALIEQYVCQFLIPDEWNSKEKSRSLKTYKEYLYQFHSVLEIRTLHQLLSTLKPGDNIDTSILQNKTLVALTKVLGLVMVKTPYYSRLFPFDQLRLIILSVMLRSPFKAAIKHKVTRYLNSLVNGSSSMLGNLKDVLEGEKIKADNADYALFHLRNFITYLTYRSGGAPKKLSFLLEQHIVPIDNQNISATNIDGFELSEDFRAVIIGHSTNNLYLRFTYYDVYTFGVINYLTTPFLHSISRYLKKYDDKLAVSSTYLLDHLYKFHSSGFSWRNLEVTPEIIDVNKAPSLRQLIYEIVHFLSNIHLENVVSGLYDFRFDQRLSQEITILSKFNLRESAAFNFTLDELQEVKKHYNRKLRQLVDLYQNRSTASKRPFFHSVAFLHGSIGDLHYYDQEYDDALVQYKDAVQNLRIDDSEKTSEDENLDSAAFLVYLRIMLRIGLTYEKKKAFASALLTYEELSVRVINFLPKFPDTIRMNLPVEDIIPSSYPDRSKASIAESLRLLYQPFLAKLYLKEKEKIGGIKIGDINLARREINYILGRVTGTDRDLIESEYFNKIGDLLFFKNRRDINDDLDQWEMYRLALQNILRIVSPRVRPVIRNIREGINATASVLWQMIATKATVSAVTLRMLANDLTDLADVVLTTVHAQPHAPTILTRMRNASITHLKGSRQDEMSRFDMCIALFVLASEVYRITHDFKKSALQYNKILHILKQNVTEPSGADVSIIEETVVVPALQDLYLAFNPSVRPEMERIKNILKLDDLTKSASLQYLPVYAEAQEVLALFLMIRHSSSDFGLNELNLNFNKICQFSNHSIPSMYSRVAVMNMKARYNKKLFDSKVQSTDEYWPNQKAYLITDSIFCSTSIIRIITSMGLSFITSHSLHGFAYEARAYWCSEYLNLKNNKELFEECSQNLKKLLGSETLDTLHPDYNYEKALIHYLHAQEAHHGKTAFMHMIDKMHYLDDDFDDEYYHFHAALERNRLERVEARIKFIKTKLPSTQDIFKVDSYLYESQPIELET